MCDVSKESKMEWKFTSSGITIPQSPNMENGFATSPMGNGNCRINTSPLQLHEKENKI